MTKLLNLSDVVNRMTGGGATPPRNIFWTKESRVLNSSTGAATPVANQWTSLWTYNGNPGAGAVPDVTGGIPTSATAGSLGQPSLASGVQQWLLSMSGVNVTGGELVLYDRLVHYGGLDAASTTPVDLTGYSPSRYTTQADQMPCEIWAEIYTQIGATPATLSVGYTNSHGVDVEWTCTVGGTGLREAQRMIPLIRVGDRGVRIINYVSLSGSTGTAGNYGLTLLRPLARLMFNPASELVSKSFVKGPLGVEIKDDACLAFMLRTPSASGIRTLGQLYCVES